MSDQSITVLILLGVWWIPNWILHIIWGLRWRQRFKEEFGKDWKKVEENRIRRDHLALGEAILFFPITLGGWFATFLLIRAIRRRSYTDE
jgi:hypothetical protein